MSIIPKTKTRAISAKLSQLDVDLIKTYMQGCVRGFCSNDSTKEFSVSVLFGDKNRDWRNTPMQRIYDFYKRIGKTDDEAYDCAAKDAGHLLKMVLNEDSDYSYDWKKGYTNIYTRK